MTSVHLLVPGALDQRTGGYNYDREVVSGLRALGYTVVVHSLSGRFPDADAEAHQSVADAAHRCEPGSAVIVDSLCLAGAVPSAAELARRGCHCVALVHHPASMEFEHQALLETERRALADMKCCIVTSTWTGELLQERFGVSRDRIVVAEPGVLRRMAFAASGVDRPTRLISVGTVSVRKDYPTLVRAVTRLQDLDWQLDCFGSLEREPDAAQAVLTLVADGTLEDRVTFHGEADADVLEAAYLRSHLFVMSSRFEGFGMVLTEALSYGLPIVATDAGPTSDVVPPGCGVVVPPAYPAELALALRRVMSDETTYRSMKRAARETAGRLAGWDTTVRTIARAIDAVSA